LEVVLAALGGGVGASVGAAGAAGAGRISLDGGDSNVPRLAAWSLLSSSSAVTTQL